MPFSIQLNNLPNDFDRTIYIKTNETKEGHEVNIKLSNPKVEINSPKLRTLTIEDDEEPAEYENDPDFEQETKIIMIGF